MGRIFKAGKQVLATPVQLKARELNWVTFRLKGIHASFLALKHSLTNYSLYSSISLAREARMEYLLTRVATDMVQIELLHKQLTKDILAKLTKEKGA